MTTQPDDFDEMNAADLFEDIFSQVVDESKIAYKAEIHANVLSDTVTTQRIAVTKSQKAKSLLKYIKTWKAGKAAWKAPKTELILLEDGYDIIKAAFKRTQAGDTAFLRACPEFARHGVLESLKVVEDNLRENWKHLVKVMKEQDPNGCMILQPFIPATSSCVLAPQQHASIGVGHDGITAGHGYHIYALLNPQESTLVEHMESIGHKKDEYELEFVYERPDEYLTAFNVAHSNDAMFTQIRGAPPSPIRAAPFTYIRDGEIMTASTDVAIPGGRAECKEVWVASGLESVAYLEEYITKDKVGEGYFISEPDGSLLSHICAHARQHGIPYVVGEVNVGDRWVEGSPTWGALDPDWQIEPQPYNPFAPDMLSQFNAGLSRSQTHWQRQQGWLAHYFHQWVGMGTNGLHTAFLAGGFVGWICKAMLAVSLGEMRHSRRLKKNVSIEMWPVLTAMMGGEKWEELGGEKKATNGRKHYYALCEQMNVDYVEMRKALEWCVKQFNTGWSGGYGGKAWAESAQRGADVCKAVLTFQAHPTEDTFKELLGAVNSAKNAEHNNGFVFNKFLSKRAFDFSDLHTDEKTGKKTGLFPHTTEGLRCMFQSFEIANHFTNGEPNESVSRPAVDWVNLFSFLKGKSADYWRHNFISSSEDVPQALRTAAENVGSELLHHGNKYTHEEHFIPCGLEDCKHCIKHEIVVMRLQYGNDLASILLTPQYPELFFAQGNDKSSVMSYAVAQMLKDRDYENVTPRMWIEAWQGLKNTDTMFPSLSTLLTKFVKNQMADSKEWTNKVLEIMKEEELE